MKNQSFEALKSFAITNPECKEEKSGSQQSNASNGSQIRVEMKKLEPMEADHSKLKANFAGLRNQPSAAKFRSHFVRLRNSPECFQIFATNVFGYFASDICCLNPNSLLVIHQLDDSLVVKQEYRGWRFPSHEYPLTFISYLLRAIVLQVEEMTYIIKRAFMRFSYPF
ncbi:hypothetical protein CK203_051121 [Vitis vinifera]|uniref:Uncharacterized protein n=1 Tax=Vitis vinifera TaxID=29760 RepID=A0A438FVX6_VITVI|nr:hypothetical protein CK203_051121 [Vitis vinifera]